MTKKQCSGPSSINFAVLAGIRGTTPLMLWFAIMNIQSAGLVISIKCGITLLLFLMSTFWYFCRENDDSKLIIMKNLSNRSTYWKICVIGLLQSALPYIFVSYALVHLPISLIGVLMVTSPWWSALFERIPKVKGTKVAGTVKVGMVFGIVGIAFMLGPIVKESISCDKVQIKINETTNSTANLTSPPNQNGLISLYDTCMTPQELALSLFYVIMAPILWGIVAVFWKFNRQDTHILVSSIGQNFIGCVVGIIVYFSFDFSADHLVTTFKGENEQMFIGTIFLGVLTGWLATLLVQNLYTSIGPKTTNQVVTTIPFIVFVEDCIFVRDVVTSYPWVVALEVLGVLFVTFGIFISNMSFTKHPKLRSGRKPISRNRGNLSDRLLDDHEGFDGDDDETTSGFYTSIVRGGNEDAEAAGHGDYEPPPMFISTSEDNHETEDEEEVVQRITERS